MQLQRTAIILALATATTLTHAQTSPDAASKALEDLLLCKPGQLFTRQSAERAFVKLGLVKQPTELYGPAKGKSVTVFDANLLDAAVSTESDQSDLSVRVTDRSADELAQQLGIKKQRVNGPSGPEMAYVKNTGKRSRIEVRPNSPRSATIECSFQ